MSLEVALGRVAELRSALAPVSPASAQVQMPSSGVAGAPAGGASQGSFADALSQAGGARAPAKAAPGSYPHLRGDLDASPDLLARLERLAASRDTTFNVNSGLRTRAEQQRLWDARHSNPFPVAKPGGSRHESGRAADVSIGGQPIQNVVGAAELKRYGLVPLAGDAVHVELA